MKIYIQNQKELEVKYLSYLLMDKFLGTDNDAKEVLRNIKNKSHASACIKDRYGVNVSVESGEDYDMRYLKIIAIDSSFQIESGLMDKQTWEVIWSFLDIEMEKAIETTI